MKADEKVNPASAGEEVAKWKRSHALLRRKLVRALVRLHMEKGIPYCADKSHSRSSTPRIIPIRSKERRAEYGEHTW